MDKKLTTTLGIALGATLLASAGFGLYKLLSKKGKKASQAGLGTTHTGFSPDFIENSLVKSTSLYGVGNELIGGGLFKGQPASLAV